MAAEDTDGPEFEVWNHLHSGLELARMEFDVLDPEFRAKIEQFAEMILAKRKAFAVTPDQKAWLEIYEYLLTEAWFRHGVEIELGWEAVGRASEALRRLFDLQPVLTKYSFTEASAQYLREVIDTYLFGFDVACVALCGAALERILQDAVTKEGIYAPSEIASKRFKASQLLNKLAAVGTVLKSYDDAKMVLEERNRILHREISDSGELKDLALRSIRALGEVVLELGERS